MAWTTQASVHSTWRPAPPTRTSASSTSAPVVSHHLHELSLITLGIWLFAYCAYEAFVVGIVEVVQEEIKKKRISFHQFHASWFWLWACAEYPLGSSGFSGFHQPPKNIPLGGLVALHFPTIWISVFMVPRIDWHLTPSVLHPHNQCFQQYSPRIYCSFDQNKVVTKDEWISASLRSFTYYILNKKLNVCLYFKTNRSIKRCWLRVTWDSAHTIVEIGA